MCPSKNEVDNRRLGRFITGLLGPNESEALLGDIEEQLAASHQRGGRGRTMLWAAGQVALALWNHLSVSLAWKRALILQHWALTWRRLMRSKVYSAINIGGLAVGMAASIIMAVWVLDALNYESGYSHSDRLYRVEQRLDTPDGLKPAAITPSPLGPVLENNYPEIEATARMMYMSSYVLEQEGRRFLEQHIVAADPSFLRLFDFKVLHGNLNQALDSPQSLVLTRKVAQKYFGDENPVGRSMRFSRTKMMIVTAVIENHPHNTHLDFEILVSLSLARELGCEFFPDTWHRADDIHTYALLAEGHSMEAVNAKIKTVKQPFEQQWNDEICLRPLKKIHVSPEVEYNLAPVVNMQHFKFYNAAAVLIFLIACMNYINLSSARALQRREEMAMRSVLGASREALLQQAFMESLFLAFVALLVAWILTVAGVEFVKQAIGKPISASAWMNSRWFWGMNGAFLLVVAFSGLFSVWLPQSGRLFHRPPLRAYRVSRAGKQLLVGLQFAIAMVLIAATMLVNSQLALMRDSDVGFQHDSVIAVSMKMSEEETLWGQQYNTFKQELLSHPGVENVSTACQSPVEMGVSAGEAHWEGQQENQSLMVRWNSVDYDYIETLGMTVLAGRSFNRAHNDAMTDMSNARFVINEAAARGMGVENPVGLQFALYGKTGPILGVVKDFHYRSFKETVDPMAMFINFYFNETLLIRLHGESHSAALDHIEETWKVFLPDWPFSWHYLNDAYQQMYEADEQARRIINGLSGLALLIAVLGLLGLVAYGVQQRSKEIGIRKVLGSSVGAVILTLARDFIKCIAAATVVALPVAWYMLNQWLQQFPYRVNLVWPLLLGSAAIAWSVAALTLLIQTTKAALANPVKSLKDE